MEMTTYYLGLIKKGRTWTADESPELDQLQTAHLAHIQALTDAGKVVTAGPLLDDGFLRGIYVFRAESIEEAQSFADADPMVKVNRLVVEIHPWMVPANGWPGPANGWPEPAKEWPGPAGEQP